MLGSPAVSSMNATSVAAEVVFVLRAMSVTPLWPMLGRGWSCLAFGLVLRARCEARRVRTSPKYQTTTGCGEEENEMSGRELPSGTF
jgi:hypothetical protein